MVSSVSPRFTVLGRGPPPVLLQSVGLKLAGWLGGPKIKMRWWVDEGRMSGVCVCVCEPCQASADLFSSVVRLH